MPTKCAHTCHGSPCTHVQVIEESLAAYATSERVQWVVAWPGQAVLCVSQKYWTAFVHESIRNGQQVERETQWGQILLF